MEATLTENAVQILTQNGGGSVHGFHPSLQVINMKNVKKKCDDTDRYRVILSDGHHFCQGCFVSNLNELANRIVTNNIIRINEYCINSIKGHLVCGIFSCDIIDSNMTETIGSPVNVDECYRNGYSQWESSN